MNIKWWPRYGVEGASSRMRVYSLHEQFKMMPGVKSEIGGHANEGDVLVVQKRTDEESLKSARDHKGIVIYDFDDTDIIPFVRWLRDHRPDTIFTTDTEGHSRDAIDALRKSECFVIPDPIDYFPDRPLLPIDGLSDAALWFGCYLNYESARWMGRHLVSRGIPVHLITDAGRLERETGCWHVPWSYKSFVTHLRQGTFSFLSHATGDGHKSANKMITSIIHGLPAIVSPTEEYLQLAREVGGINMVVATTAELDRAVEFVKSTPCLSEWLPQAQAYIWEKYHARVVAKQLMDLIQFALTRGRV